MKNIYQLPFMACALVASLYSMSVLALDPTKEGPISTREFVEQATVQSVSTIKAAKKALEHTDSQLVTAYAQKMVDEYKNIEEDLMELGDKKNLEVARKPLKNDASEKVLTVNDKKAFDVAYAKDQLGSHQYLIALFQRASESEDYDTRTLAKRTLPHLERHLQMAEHLYSVTAESKTDIYQDRDGKVDYSDEDEVTRTPTTDMTPAQ